MGQLSKSETRSGLAYNQKSGKPLVTIGNFLTIMQNDRRYDGIRYNVLAQRAEIHSVVNGDIDIQPWTDADEAASRNYIESAFELYSKDKHSDALRILFKEREYNPIIDIIDGVEWDGVERCESFLTRWALCDDTPYVREVSRLIFAGGIHRLYAPGTKFDDVPILIGVRQGEGKSSLVRFLAINDKYYGEVTTMEGQQAIEQLQGKWICEISELLALTKTKEQEAAKAYITRAVDSYRKPWDKNVTDLPRRCVFIGTTNNPAPLTDKRNRRYYPVEVHSSGYDILEREEEIRDYIMQCWAEARDKFKEGKMPNFANRRLVKEYQTAQENATQDDWREGAIRAFLEKKTVGEYTCTREICHMALCPDPDRLRDPSPIESREIGMIMTLMEDWKKVGNHRVGRYGSQKAWQKVDAEPEPQSRQLVEPSLEDDEWGW